MCQEPKRNGGPSRDWFQNIVNSVQERKDKETKDVANMFKTVMVSVDHKTHDKLWYLDSGAPKHVNGDMNAMFKLLGVGPS